MAVFSEEFLETHLEKESYTEIHAALIDLVMSVRTIRQTDLLLYLQKALLTRYIDFTEDPTNKESLQSLLESEETIPDVNLNTLSTVLASINTRLQVLDMEIVESKDIDNSEINLFTFVNKKPAGAIHLSTKYSQNDIQLVKHVIDRIFASEYVNENSVTDESGDIHQQIKYHVPYMKMIQSLRNGPPQAEDDDAPLITKLSLEESELFLRDLEIYGWLERDSNNYTLATRGLVELKKYLIDTYGNYPEGTISVCFGCGDILTRGFACPNGHCNVHFHRHCQELVTQSRNDNTCPNDKCNEDIRTFYSF
jgi:hypothetical protein